MKEGVKYNIDSIKASGEPLTPKNIASKFVRQCGVLVKDQLPISIQEWKEPKTKRPDVTWVDDRAKQKLWESLMEHFTLFQVRHRVRPHLLLQVRHSVRPLLLLQLSHVSRLRRLSNRRRDTPQLWCVAVRVEVVQKVQAETSDINMVQATSLLFLRGLTT